MDIDTTLIMTYRLIEKGKTLYFAPTRLRCTSEECVTPRNLQYFTPAKITEYNTCLVVRHIQSNLFVLVLFVSMEFVGRSAQFQTDLVRSNAESGLMQIYIKLALTLSIRCLW